MKKLLSILIATLLIIGTITAPLNVAAADAEYELGDELITNGDFSATNANTKLGAICSHDTNTIAQYVTMTQQNYHKWFRPTAGVAVASDLYANQTATPDTNGEYPVYFKQNSTVLEQPDKSGENVLRVTQNAMQYINATANSTYKLSFKYRIGGKTDFYTNASTGKKQLRIYLGAFKPVQSNGVATDKISSSAEVLIPVSNTDFSYDFDETASVINGSIYINFTPDNKWHNAEITFTTGDRNLNTTADYDANGDGVIDTSLLPMLTFYQEIGSTISINGENYLENAFYLDDVSLKEVKFAAKVNVGSAEIYDTKGNKLTNNESVTVSQTKNKNNLLATVNYSKNSGLKFIGWYNDNTEVAKTETLTVASDDTTLYTPRFETSNLAYASASFESYANGTDLTHTDKTTQFPTGALWGGIKTAGYRGQTFFGTFYDNQGNEYTQNTTGSYSQATTTKVSSDYSYSGNNSLYFKGAAWAFGSAIEGVKPGKTYTVSYRVKRDPTVTSRTHIKATAVLTTLNIGANKGVNTSFENHICNLYDTFSLVNQKNIDISNDTWNIITMEFTVPAKATNLTTVYLVMDCSGNEPNTVNQFYMDDLVVLEKKEEIKIDEIPVEFVNAKGEVVESKNAYGKVAIDLNDDDTVNLTLNYIDSFAYTFLGWYDNENKLVSTETTLENVATEAASTYKAKIKDANIYTAASYEGYSNSTSLSHAQNSTNAFPINGEWGGFAWAGYRKQTVAGTIYDNQGNAYTQTAGGTYSNGISATVSSDYAHSGSKSLLLKGRYWTMVGGINGVKPGKTYEFSMWVKTDPSQAEAKQIKGAAILTTVNIGQSGITEFATHITEKYSSIGLAWDDGKYFQSNIPLSNDGWTKISTRFTVPAKATTLDTVYISLDASGSDPINAYNIYIDDVSVSEVFDGIQTAYNSAAALRTATASSTGKNGMRICNKIEKDFIEEYSIKEYGSIAILNSNLEGELTLDNEKAVKGVAYNSETKPTAILFDQTETANIYTSYLSNIPEKRYAEAYTVRAYAIDGSGSVIYGESINVSVYDVALAMDNGNAVTTQTDKDIAAFKVFAGGKDGKFTMYDTYLKTELKFAGKLRNIAKAEDTLSGDALTNALEVEGYYEPLFERAIANVGNRAMLKAMFEKAARGEDITVVGFGGSITQKAACTNELDSYSHLVAAWLREQFPDITVNWYNAGIGSTTSVLGIARMQDHVLAYNPDLVLLDFTTNDQSNDYHAGSYEAILRTLYEKQIAVVTIAFGNVNNSEYNNQGLCHRGTNREDLHGPVMLYNDVPVIDYYGVMWDCYLDADGDGYNVESDAAHWKVLWNDYIHPTKIGHKLAANAINHYLGKVLADIENITENATCPATPYDKYTESFMGSMMYGEANIGSLLTDSYNVTIGTYKNYDSTTVSNWTIWQIGEGGYVEFTIDKCKMFALMSVNNPSSPKAEIYINDEKVTTHTANRSDGELNWMNFIKFFDGKDTVKVKIKCISGTYRITSALIAK